MKPPVDGILIEQPGRTKTDGKEEGALAGESVKVRRCQAEGVARAKVQRGKVSAGVHGPDGVAGGRWAGRRRRDVVGETGRGRRTRGLRGTERGLSDSVGRRGGQRNFFSREP